MLQLGSYRVIPKWRYIPRFPGEVWNVISAIASRATREEEPDNWWTTTSPTRAISMLNRPDSVTAISRRVTTTQEKKYRPPAHPLTLPHAPMISYMSKLLLPPLLHENPIFFENRIDHSYSTQTQSPLSYRPIDPTLSSSPLCPVIFPSCSPALNNPRLPQACQS